MASFIKVFKALGPRIRRQPTVRQRQLSQRMADTTGQRRGEILRVLLELQLAMQHFLRAGSSLQVEGVGTFRPSMRGDGRVHVLFEPDRELLVELNGPGALEGLVLNRRNIGAGPADYKAQWDALHPEDPMEMPPGWSGEGRG